MAPEFGKPVHQLPLIPADVLKKHRVHEPLDTRFRSAARLLQALWREDRDLPIGSYVNEGGKQRLYVAQSIFDKVVEGVADVAKKIKLGPGLAPTTEMGPLVSEIQLNRVCGYLVVRI